MPTKKAKPAVSKAKEEQSWAVQSEQERGLLSEVSLQALRACGGGEADLRKEEMMLRVSLGVDLLRSRHNENHWPDP